MDYKEKYEQALKVATEIHRFSSDLAEIKRMEQIFPELKENEYERIKHFLIDTFKKQYLAKDKLGKWHGEPVTNILDWLENRYQVKIPKFKAGNTIRFKGFGGNMYTIKEVCGTSHYINTLGNRMDMAYTDANFELVETELVECGEDEKIRKELIQLISCMHDADHRKKDWLAWLEKQKPIEWADEDKQYLLVCKNALYKYQASDKWDADIIYSWLHNRLKQLMGDEK